MTSLTIESQGPLLLLLHCAVKEWKGCQHWKQIIFQVFSIRSHSFAVQDCFQWYLRCCLLVFSYSDRAVISEGSEHLTEISSALWLATVPCVSILFPQEIVITQALFSHQLSCVCPVFVYISKSEVDKLVCAWNSLFSVHHIQFSIFSLLDVLILWHRSPEAFYFYCRQVRPIVIEEWSSQPSCLPLGFQKASFTYSAHADGFERCPLKVTRWCLEGNRERKFALSAHSESSTKGTLIISSFGLIGFSEVTVARVGERCGWNTANIA